jgi:hypothetical protein
MFGFFKKRKETGVSKGGSTVYEYEKTDKVIAPGNLPENNEPTMEAITNHIEKYIGKVDYAFHELVSSLVHIDVLVVYPTPERNFYTLVTSGMSGRPMNIPAPELKGWAYGEVMLCLPPDWKLDQESFKDERNYWPIRMMKFIARFPHEYNSWISYGHSIPNGNPPAAVANGIGFCGVLLELPVTVQDPEFHVLKLNDKSIRFYGLLPLHAAEMDFKLQEGSDALVALFDKQGVNELVDARRGSVVTAERRG